jgi:hypothetical protein
MATKIVFTQQMQAAATKMAQVSDDLIDLRTIYFDRGYNSGAGSIVDDDISALNVSASHVVNMITMIENLDKFLNASAITEADYDSTVNQMRTDK